MIDEIKITSLSNRGSIVMKTGDHRGYWLGKVDWGQVEGQHQTYSFYNQVGENIISTTVPMRPISIEGWVIDGGMDTLQNRCDFLNTFISPVEDYYLEFKNKKIQFRPDASVKYSRESRSNNRLLRKFLIQATAPHSLFTNLENMVTPFDSSGKLFRFPTNFGQETPLVFASLTKTYNMEVFNTGGFETGLIAKIKFVGEVVNFRLKNLTTGKYVGINRTFSKGERLEICTIPGSKSMTLTLEDGTTQNLIKYRDFQTSWIQLVPGVNLLALDCDDLEQRINMEVVVYFTPLYLEVE